MVMGYLYDCADKCFHVEETLQHSCLSPDNSLEALFMEVLNCVNSAGHPAIYFTGSVSVFSPYSPGLERY